MKAFLERPMTMNIYEWISAGVSRIVAGTLIILFGFGIEIVSIHVRVAQSKKKLDDLLKVDRQGIRISVIPLMGIFLYDLIKALPPWEPLALTMCVVGTYAGVRWTERMRGH